MPFIPHTPESLVRRSDSKDPATTCKGITSSGRPCRRPLGASPQASPTAPRKSKNGVIAVLEQQDNEHDGAAAFFCWQHQDQAQTLASSDQNGRRANIVPLQPRTSIDTLAERLGVLDVEEDDSPSEAKKKRQHTRPARKETLPQKWQDMDGPLLAVNSGRPKTRRTNEPSQTSFLGFFCCIGSADNDHLPPPRPQNDAEKIRRTHNRTSSIPLQVSPPRTPRPNDHRHSSHRPSFAQAPPSQTESFLSLILKTLSPQTTALLLAELAKPISPHDEEGYIYIFWLTDSAVPAPDTRAASSLLNDDAAPSTPTNRRKSSTVQSPLPTPSGKQATILLKIGRASNVQRRMNEWTRQCGYNLSLIRFYPHIPSSTQQAPSSPTKVPHAHKVERLIHIELSEQRVTRTCAACGREHREWFEIESSRLGLKGVDDVVRRWVGWGMRGAGGG